MAGLAPCTATIRRRAIVTMIQSRNLWRAIYWTIPGLLFTAAAFLFMLLSNSRIAYVYHPATDIVYLITLGPEAGEYDRAPLMLPYTTPLFGGFKSVVSLGPLAPLGTPSAKGTLSSSDQISAGSHTEDRSADVPRELYVMANPEYTQQHGIDAATLIPRRWDMLRAYLDSPDEELMAADIILIPPATHSDTRVRILHAALFVRGDAAADLWDAGVH